MNRFQYVQRVRVEEELPENPEAKDAKAPRPATSPQPELPRGLPSHQLLETVPGINHLPGVSLVPLAPLACPLDVAAHDELDVTGSLRGRLTVRLHFRSRLPPGLRTFFLRGKKCENPCPQHTPQCPAGQLRSLKCFSAQVGNVDDWLLNSLQNSPLRNTMQLWDFDEMLLDSLRKSHLRSHLRRCAAVLAFCGTTRGGTSH